METNISEQIKEKPKKKKIFLIILIIFLSLMIVASSLIVGGFFYIKKILNYRYNEITEVPEELGFEEVISDKTVNIALFGIDTRTIGSFKGRSDSIMILSINITDKKVKLVSVLRDTLVPIEHNGSTAYNKINNAYATGGPELAIKTLNKIFGLDISEYATVNFYGMANIIDVIGGIEVTLTEDELMYVNAGVAAHCDQLKLDSEPYRVTKAGKQHLNGIQAVAYSRIRYTANAQGTSNDYGRTDRQRYILGQLFAKATALKKTQMVDLIETLSPYCEMSLTHMEVLDLAVSVLLHSPTLEESRVPFTDYTMRQPSTSTGSVVYYDLDYAANIIHAFIYEDIKPEDYIKKYGIRKNDWYTNGYKPPIIVKTADLSAKAESSASSGGAASAQQ